MRVLSIAIATSIIAAATPASAETPKKLTLPQLIARAKSSPRVEAARQRLLELEARRDRASNLVPAIDLSIRHTWLRDPRCDPSATDCRSTRRRAMLSGLDGAWTQASASTSVLLYGFGRRRHARRAAAAAIDAGRAGVRARRADVELDAARAYYALKLARAMAAMLDEGDKHARAALAEVRAQLAAGKGEATEMDRHRLGTLRAEIDIRRASVKRAAAAALAAVRALAGAPGIDVDGAPLAVLAGRAFATGSARERPEWRGVEHTARAMSALAGLAGAAGRPELLLVGDAHYSNLSAGLDSPRNAFFNRFDTSVATISVVARWRLDLGGARAGARAARARAARARAMARAAKRGLDLELRRASAALHATRQRLEAARRGEKSARAWLVALDQSADVGDRDAKQTAEALSAFFTMRARVIQAIYDLNLATLERARAGGVELAALFR